MEIEKPTSKVESILCGSIEIKYISCKTNMDVQAGVYEGGYQLWECTTDLLKYLQDYDFNGKVVMDLGCGQGVLGILALLRGAKCVIFQDFNLDVLKQLTQPNITLNIQHNPSLIDRCSFQYGDWATLQDYPAACPHSQVDLVIGSQLIYNPSSYAKLSGLLRSRLANPEGIALLANKVFYFGCGGNLNDFKEHLEEAGLRWQQRLRIVPERGGNKKEITAIGLPA